MALVTLVTAATDQGDFPLKITFTDSITGLPVVPNSTGLVWDLYNENSSVINNRTSVDVSGSAASTMFFPLEDADLAYSDGEFRIFELKGHYNSTSFGNNIRFNVAIKFRITKTK